MKMTCRKAAALIGIAFISQASFAQKQADVGKQEYEWHCAICHGESGRGDGEMRKWLTKAPSNLTTISKRNGGAFPNELMWEVIDGRSEVAAHGTRAMPVWGQRYRVEALSDPGMARAPEWEVRNRIVALLDYLSRIQEK